MNRTELMNYYAGRGRVFGRQQSGDAETMANLIFREEGIVAGIRSATVQIKGSFTFLMLTREGIVATVSQDNHWPMVIGEQDGAVAIASESTCFSNLGFKHLRDLKAGEIVILKEGVVTSISEINPVSVQICKFLWVYTDFPPASICGVSASLVRERLGASLARTDIENGFIPDIVSYVPDSGRCHGIGYHNEYCRAMNSGEIKRVPLLKEVLFKYPYTGRSYTPKDQEARDREAYLKIIPSSDRFDGLRLALLEDSVVRGTQIENSIAPKLRSLGFAEIHVRASNPELLSPCPWGKSTKLGEILALKFPDLDERAKALGVDSIRYNSIESLNRAVCELNPNTLCIDCALI
jgi:amidophosphoribosyltransferase